MTFDDFLTQTQARRNELDAYARSPLPIGNDSAGELNALITAEDDAQRLLADAETFLVQSQAKAMFAARQNHQELNAKERELVIKAECANIQRIVDGIAVTARTISNRRYLMMNVNRSR